MDKPENLYRGITLSYDKLKDFDFFGDLVVPYEPIFNEAEEAVVRDGNEYGVYMSDNEQMVMGIYGNARLGGTAINKDIMIGVDRRLVDIAKVAVVYTINPNGLDIRKPRITSYLEGVYNNGYGGDEWIANSVPVSNYEITRIRIGNDLLHDIEDILLLDGGLEPTKELILNKMQMRKYRLDALLNELAKLTPQERYRIDSERIEVLRSVFGADGVRYTLPEAIDTSDNLGVIKFLQANFYHKSTSLDFKTLLYLEKLKDRVAKSEAPESFETIKHIIGTDLEAVSSRMVPEESNLVLNQKKDMLSVILNATNGIKGKQVIKPDEFRIK